MFPGAGAELANQCPHEALDFPQGFRRLATVDVRHVPVADATGPPWKPALQHRPVFGFLQRDHQVRRTQIGLRELRPDFARVSQRNPAGGQAVERVGRDRPIGGKMDGQSSRYCPPGNTRERSRVVETASANLLL